MGVNACLRDIWEVCHHDPVATCNDTAKEEAVGFHCHICEAINTQLELCPGPLISGSRRGLSWTGTDKCQTYKCPE